MIGSALVRPYWRRPTLLPGHKPPIQPRVKFFPMAHSQTPKGDLLCGETGFDGLEPEGSPAAGFALYVCDDCEWEVAQVELDREDADRYLEDLPTRFTEETTW